MNDQITELYERMFSPEPIPPKVKRLFDRANFLLNRIDAPAMKIWGLAIIAACAETLDPSATTLPDEDRLPVELHDLINTSEEDPDLDPTPQPTNPGGPTGPMDAPRTPSATRRGLAATKMEKMTMVELRAHALEFYGYKAPGQYKKSEIIAVLKSKQPIK